MKIVIIGAGPTGLGAAYRLKELGHEDFIVLERNSYAGGLATSFEDEQGFTWDFGGHIQFSHYDYFNKVMDEAVEKWNYIDREAWIWLYNTFVPYPFQHNLHRLPPEVMLDCIKGIINRKKKAPLEVTRNFQEWIDSNLGSGIAKHFMVPYNTKVWAYPPKMLNASWVGDRAVEPDLERIIENTLLKKDDVSWGPNNKFRFPEKGGTGQIWKNIANELKGYIEYNMEVKRIDTSINRVYTRHSNSPNDNWLEYDFLINTSPMDWFIKNSDLHVHSDMGDIFDRSEFTHSSVYVVGIGMKGKPSEKLKNKSWMYFPEDNCPFFRVTVFSNYSKYNTPGEGCWSLMCETSESDIKRVNATEIINSTIKGLKNVDLIKPTDGIISKWLRREEYGYPTPYVRRDIDLALWQEILMKKNIYSRGRFGGWKYEVSNQDHSFMSGCEAADNILLGKKEITYFHPEIINGR